MLYTFFWLHAVEKDHIYRGCSSSFVISSLIKDTFRPWIPKQIWIAETNDIYNLSVIGPQMGMLRLEYLWKYPFAQLMTTKYVLIFFHCFHSIRWLMSAWEACLVQSSLRSWHIHEFCQPVMCSKEFLVRTHKIPVLYYGMEFPIKRLNSRSRDQEASFCSLILSLYSWK